MKNVLISVGVLVVLALMAGTAMVSSYNGLVRTSQGVDAQWAQVQNVYQRRADLVPNLVATVSGAANFEKSTLIAVTDARASVGRVNVNPSAAPTDPAQLQQFQKAQGDLSSALSRLMVVVEKYPDLKSNQSFLELQVSLEGTENRISVERGRFNETVQNYDTRVSSFPTVFLARLFGFTPKPYFTAAPEAEKAPSVKFDFNTPAPTTAH